MDCRPIGRRRIRRSPLTSVAPRPAPALRSALHAAYSKATALFPTIPSGRAISASEQVWHLAALSRRLSSQGMTCFRPAGIESRYGGPVFAVPRMSRIMLRQ